MGLRDELQDEWAEGLEREKAKSDEQLLAEFAAGVRNEDAIFILDEHGYRNHMLDMCVDADDRYTIWYEIFNSITARSIVEKNRTHTKAEVEFLIQRDEKLARIAATADWKLLS